MDLSTFDTVAVLFVVASIFGFVNHKVFRLPFAIGVMAAGLVSSFILLVANSALDLGLGNQVVELLRNIDFAEALMHGMLSFLLFAGALHTDMKRLREWALPIFSLASIGVLISTAVIGTISYTLFGLLGSPVPFMFCLVLGALITPTDPVAVLGIMKAAGAPKDIEIKVIGESLFNDGVGVVLFTVLLALAVAGQGGEPITVVQVFELLVVEVLGGIALGLVGGYITFLALKTLDEPNLEILISVSLVMGMTFFAFQVHTSAPLACVVAGLFIGNEGRERAMGESTERALDIVWSFIDEALNAILFLLIGLEIMIINFNASYIAASIAIIFIGLSARAAAVYFPITFLKSRLKFLPGTRRILWWGGIKGGISIALALSLPEFEGRDIVLAVTYATVVSSVLVQGLSIGQLIQRVAPVSKVEAENHH